MSGTTVRKRTRKAWYGMFGAFVAVFLFAFLITKANQSNNNVDAASLDSFDPGFIISDWQMSNYTSMSEADIQSFLWSKGKCYNTNFSGVGTRVDYFSDSTPPTTWHVSNGHTVCLAEENMNGETAAHIIWQTAQDYRINPQVLIVLLQKETGMITDPIPNSWDYQRAAGYGCPDTAACSSKYYGFKNQIRNAAALFRTVLDGGWTNYPLGENYIQYNSNSACGGSVVNVRSLATSALYRYTPYQPNAGALAAGSGTAPCGAYGNRNFYLYFQDWFGGITDTNDIKLEDLDQKTVMSGVYYIASAQNDKALMVGDTINGGNIYVGKNTGATMQKWRITKAGDYYTIVNAETGRAVDVTSGSFVNNSNVWQIELNETCAQRWVFAQNTDGTVTIHNACKPNFVLDLQDADTNVQIYSSTRDGNKNQRWKLTLAETKDYSGTYNIVSAANGKTMTVENMVNGGNIYVDSNANVSSQRWQVTKVGDYYTIVNKLTGRSIDVYNAKFVNNSNVWQIELNKTCAQRWLFGDNGDGTVTIHNACNPKFVLDLQDGKTNVQIYSLTSAANKSQKWTLKSVKATEDYSGTYRIVSARNDKALMVGNTVNGGNVYVGMATDVSAQQWQISWVDNYYTIVNKLTGRSIDVYNANFVNNSNVWQIELNKTCAQRWLIGGNSDGSVTIYNACNPEFVLDLQDGTTNIQIYKSTGGNNKNQQWKLEAVADKDYSGDYYISSARNNKLMMVNSSSNGSNIYVGENARASANQWRISKVGNYYTIVNKMSGRSIDVYNANFVNNSNVWQIELNKTRAQRWLIGGNSDGSVTVYNACNPEFVLDLQDGTTNIQIYKSTNDANQNQRWKLTKI